MTGDVIPRRVTLYSAAFGVGHEESEAESDSDIDMGNTEMDVELDAALMSTPAAMETLPEDTYVSNHDGS
ncbi:hypothetical protein FBU31_006145, partial [Coemansia sp. 'formosensis']